MASAPADFARASAPRMARTLRASRRPPRAARRAEIAPFDRRLLGRRRRRPPSRRRRTSRSCDRRPSRTASTARSYASDATTSSVRRLATRDDCRRVAPHRPRQHFFEWQTKLMDDLATKYAKTDDAAAPASTAAKASSSSSSSSDDPPATRSSRRSPWARASRTWAKSSPSGGSRAFLHTRAGRGAGTALEGGRIHAVIQQRKNVYHGEKEGGKDFSSPRPSAAAWPRGRRGTPGSPRRCAGSRRTPSGPRRSRAGRRHRGPARGPPCSRRSCGRRRGTVSPGTPRCRARPRASGCDLREVRRPSLCVNVVRVEHGDEPSRPSSAGRPSVDFRQQDNVRVDVRVERPCPSRGSGVLQSQRLLRRR